MTETRGVTLGFLHDPPDGGRGRARGCETFVAYREAIDVNWSDELSALHQESSRDHFIDVATRRALVDSVADRLWTDAVVADLGCSTGYLLKDLAAAAPAATLVGVDLVAHGLRQAHREAPTATLLLADLLDLPIVDASIDVIVSANVLEHIADHRRALAEMHRILRPGGRAALVVPGGPGLHDYYDEFLGHERRYGRNELARVARSVGFAAVDDFGVGVLLYPAFWAVKKRNRRKFAHLSAEDRRARVAQNIERTRRSKAAEAVQGGETWVRARGLRIRGGIRHCVVVERRRP